MEVLTSLNLHSQNKANFQEQSHILLLHRYSYLFLFACLLFVQPRGANKMYQKVLISIRCINEFIPCTTNKLSGTKEHLTEQVWKTRVLPLRLSKTSFSKISIFKVKSTNKTFSLKMYTQSILSAAVYILSNSP